MPLSISITKCPLANSPVSNSPKLLDKNTKTHLYRVNLNLKRSSVNSHPSVCCFLLLINTFLLVFMNIFLQLEANPVQMCLLYFYPAVLVNSKLEQFGSTSISLERRNTDKEISNL